ncbi:DUF1800 domain-containing protein [Candidatus Obscuribacterales bacterium]|nr:DUF1800 domain-containing protein [Candidatus Obscuribacterales bacterium]
MERGGKPRRVSRRAILKAGALLGGGTLLSGCERVISETTERLGLAIPAHIAVGSSTDIDPVFHLLSRAAYAPWPGDVARVRAQGIENWIDEQLEPESIDDSLCDMRSRRFETISMRPGDCYEFKDEALRNDITRHTLLKAIYSKRQLFEVMVAFWTDHLNINLEKGDCIYLKASDDRDVVRKHALGNFKDLIRASALSPAMLVYLDGKENKREKNTDIPNENYARELLELHTLGVNGGYTQKDVFEAARCLTGWRLHQRGEFAKGSVYFDKTFHDDGEKIVLGKTITAGGGDKDIDALIEIVTAHPSTARYVAGKLVRFFVADEPPPSLVERVAKVFSAEKGEIRPMVRMILTSKEFSENRGNKFKRPFRFVVSSLRLLGADTFAKSGLTEYLSRMGHGPFQYPTPDGYPEEMSPWLGTLLWRWNFALALSFNELDSVTVHLDELRKALTSKKEPKVTADLLIRYLCGRKSKASEIAVLKTFQQPDKSDPATSATEIHLNELLGLVIASPAFQRF